ncbi:unnamed protein product [Paramecium sonneborni]|uniref:Uncharacterized protein n=1 Tax=Paramecium sonneborni TaxID=65129 RepID=A0A8S1RSG3_9CILI|nr:unnamed protein product [Paramecium sonneborni]
MNYNCYFFEQIWKGLVIIVDLNTQWQQDHFQSVVDILIESYKERLEKMKNDYKQQEEKYQMQLRGYQLKLTIEQKMKAQLREENYKICQQYIHLEDQMNEFNNNEHAKGDLQNINLKLHEIDLNFIRFNKDIYESHQQAVISQVINCQTKFTKIIYTIKI